MSEAADTVFEHPEAKVFIANSDGDFAQRRDESAAVLKILTLRTKRLQEGRLSQARIY